MKEGIVQMEREMNEYRNGMNSQQIKIVELQKQNEQSVDEQNRILEIER